MTEALTVRLAVMTAAFSNIKFLTIRSNFLVLIKLLESRESRPTLFGIVFDIYHFSSYFFMYCLSPLFSVCIVAKSALTAELKSSSAEV